MATHQHIDLFLQLDRDWKALDSLEIAVNIVSRKMILGQIQSFRLAMYTWKRGCSNVYSNS